MKIEYVHFSAPDEVRVYDTKVSLLACTGFMRAMGRVLSQEEWDEHTLHRMTEDKERGYILRYEICEEATA